MISASQASCFYNSNTTKSSRFEEYEIMDASSSNKSLIGKLGKILGLGPDGYLK